VVPPERELAFLHPLPVERLWGVGPKTSAKLHARGLTTVGRVAMVSEDALVCLLGRASGRHLHALAHNRDPRRVEARRRRRSIGSQRALGRSRLSADDLDAVLVGLVDRVTQRLRGTGRVARTVVVRLRFDDFSRATRSRTLPQATSHTHTILVAARGLLLAAAPLVARRGLTLVGITLADLGADDAVQLALPLEARDGLALDVALDAVRERFGKTAVTRAVLLGRDPGLTMPLLPD
jgi:DNA polymerase-4